MPRKGASSNLTKSSKRNTKHKSKDKKEEIEEEKKQQFADYQEQINSIQKRKPKDFELTYEVRKIINMLRWNKKLILNIWNLKYLKCRKML